MFAGMDFFLHLAERQRNERIDSKRKSCRRGQIKMQNSILGYVNIKTYMPDADIHVDMRPSKLVNI